MVQRTHLLEIGVRAERLYAFIQVFDDTRMLDGDDGSRRNVENRRCIFGLLAGSAGIQVFEAEHPEAMIVHDGWDALCPC